MSVEHPKLWGGIVDLDHESSAAEAAGQLFKFLREPDGEDMVAFRAGQRYVARIQRDESIMSVPAPFQIDKGATYLIVGGLGGLGLATARWLSKLGARNLALISRSGPDAEATRAIQALEKSGVSIRVYRADVSRAEDMALAMASIKSTMPPLKGVLHLAGVLDDAMLSDQNWERFHAVGLAKVEGAWVLHKLTEEDALDFFVLFSSMAALVTMPGQGNYAAANCFLDALANYRRSIGLTALTVNWGPWGEIGHAATEYGRNAHRQLAQLGIDAISPRQGLELLDTLLGQQQTQVCIAQVNWSKLFQNHPAAADSPLLREQVRHAALPAATIEDTEFVKVIRALPEDERRDALSSFLSDLIAKALKLNDGERLAPQQGLFALGLDSILALQLKSQLEISLGRSFRATLFFTHPNIASLSEHLLSELEFGSSASAPKTATLEFQEAGTESIDQTMPLDTLSEEEIANLIVREIGYGKEISGTGSRRMEEPAGG
jgi:NAD(P)-dependent dehydrogenase (short-subunit alcohol dehydrogenase family)/aryl carrier-like protein